MRHLVPEIRDQLFQRREIVGHLRLPEMLVIALAGFVVEAQYANLIDHECHPVFETMRAALGRPRQKPDHDLRETVFRNDPPFAQQQSRRMLVYGPTVAARSTLGRPGAENFPQQARY